MRYPDIATLYSIFRKTPQVTTDSRKAAPGTLFFALKGDNFNGNGFAETALKQGCSYAVIDEEAYYHEDSHYILVKDCLRALQDLAAYHRTQLKIPFLAITGSNGKTTTKEFIRNVLSKKYKVLATTGNLNNHIGVPLTVLSVTPDIEIAVIEMGANHIGEIAMLCEIAQPDYGLITNIGRAHIGEFGSFEAIVKAKTEMYEFLRKKKGKVFINSSNSLLLEHASGIEQITYGDSEKDFCSCLLLDADPYVRIKYGSETIHTQLIGRYNFENIVASVCIGKYFGVETGKIREAIEAYVPSNNRSQILKTKNNTLVLDAYNANPSSMKAALQNFEEMAGDNKWLILGDMRELGTYALQEHRDILNLASSRFKNVILVGSVFAEAAKGSSGFRIFPDTDKLIEMLKRDSPIKDPSLILVKGSRGIQLEKAVEFL